MLLQFCKFEEQTCHHSFIEDNDQKEHNKDQGNSSVVVISRLCVITVNL